MPNIDSYTRETRISKLERGIDRNISLAVKNSNPEAADDALVLLKQRQDLLSARPYRERRTF